MGLMDKAREREPDFKKPDVGQFIPEDAQDAVSRVVAAGMKIMYSPETRDDLVAEVQREEPIPQKMAQSVTGLMLTLDSQSKGGIPMRAMFPAAMELLGEAAEVLSAAGQRVTQADYNDAAGLMFVLMAKKMGAADGDIEATLKQAAGGGEPAPQEPEMA